MYKLLLSATAALSMTFIHVQASEACGQNLTVKQPKLKRASKSSHPSTILVVGSSNSNLANRLKKAGHTVETVDTVSSAKRDNYRVVLADPEQYDSANKRYRSSIVIKRTPSASMNQRRVERKLAEAKTPMRRDSLPGQVGNSKSDKRLVAVGGSETARDARQPSDSAGGEILGRDRRIDAKVEKKVIETPVREKKLEKKTETVETTDAVVEKKTEVASGSFTREFYFGTNSNELNARSKKRLRANAAWLKAHPGVSITIEGHTDTVGDADFNRELGERRAEAAKTFLVGLGIDASRIDVVSKGEDEPAFRPGSSGKNRRVVLIKH